MKKNDTTIIEIKEDDNISNINYLQLEDTIINDIINEKDYNCIDNIDSTVYIIHYPDGKLSVSYGILYDVVKDDDNEKFNFLHRCNTNYGSSGSPVLNEKNKVIGIHKENYVYHNFKGGTFLNYPIKEFIEKNYDYTKNLGKNIKMMIMP